MSSALLNPKDRFPYCNIFTVYLKCGQSERLRQKFRNVLPLIYPECIDAIYPVTKDYITDAHFTYNIQVLKAEAFYRNYCQQYEVYPWHVNEVGIIVPYGNIDDWGTRSLRPIVHVARTMKNIWHASRLIKNRTPTQRSYINLGIPWLRLECRPDDLTDQELYDYCEVVLSSCSAQLWVMDRQVIKPHVHCN